MAQFRQYNIQLLPLDTRSTSEVGVEGYKALFDQLKEHTSKTYKKKEVIEKAFLLVNESFIYPFVVHTEDEYGYGRFVKFHKAETVTELYSSERLFEAPPGKTAVTNKFEFRFVVDFEKHVLAVEEVNGRLPSAATFLEALEKFFKDIEPYFPAYVLKINLIADQVTLTEVLTSGNEFGAVHVKLTFPNGHKLNDTMRELRDKNVHNVDVRVAPERGTRMPDVPSFAKDLLENAGKFGWATITFFRKMKPDASLFKRFTYSTLDHPDRFTLKQKKKETESQFIERVWHNLRLKATFRDDNQ